jgi:hypothetical protein
LLALDLQLALDRDGGPHRMFASLAEFSKMCKARMDVYVDKGPTIPRFIARRCGGGRGGGAGAPP